MRFSFPQSHHQADDVRITPVKRGHHPDAQHNSNKEVTLKRLLLRFMAKQLLTKHRTRPSPHQSQHQQRRLRHSAPAFARRHFIPAVDDKRQHAGEQQPHHQRVRQQRTGDRR